MTVRGYPHKQPFCAHPRRNLTKKNAWWQKGNTNNRKQGRKEGE